MKEGMGEHAVRAVQFACMEKYPAPKNNDSVSTVSGREGQDEIPLQCLLFWDG